MLTNEELLQLKLDLDIASDKLSIKWKEFEADLKKLGLGVEGKVKISDNVSLGYYKHEKEWHVYVFCDNPDGTESIWEVERASRSLRMHCYKHRLKLVESLEEIAKSLLMRINRILNSEIEIEESIGNK